LTFPEVKTVPLTGSDAPAGSSVNGSQSLVNPRQAGPTGSASTGADPRFATYDPTNGVVYVADYGVGGIGDTVSAISGTSDTVTSVTVGRGPFEMAYDPQDGSIYVPDSGASTVSVINATTNQVATVNVCSEPHSATYDPTNGYIYVPCWLGQLSVIKGGSSVSTLTIGGDPRNAAYDPSNGLLYVTDSLGTNSDGYLTVIYTSNFTIDKNIPVGEYPNSTVYDPYHGYVYVSNPLSNDVSVIEVANNSEKNVTVGSTPQGLTYDPVNHRVYVGDWGTSNSTGVYVSVINGTRNETILDVGHRPYYGVYNPANGWIYFADFGSSAVSVIQPTASNDFPSQNISVGTAPFSVTYDPGNGGIYVPNEGSSNLTIIPTGVETNVSSPSVQSSPRFPAVDTFNGYVYVPNYDNNSVSVINGTTNTPVTSPLSLPSGSEPWSAIFDPVNSRVYVVDTGIDKVSVISGTTVIANVTVGSYPLFALFNPAGDNVYVFDSATVDVSVISPTDLVTTISGVGANPLAGAFDPRNDDIYVSDSGSSTVTPINGETGAKLANITVGGGPWFPAYDSSNGYVYVPSSISSTVSVISGSNVTNVPVSHSENYFATYDSSNGLVYVPSQCGGVSVISGTALVAMVPAGLEPTFAGSDPGNGLIFVTNYGGANVTVLNGSLPIATFAAGTTPRWAVYDPISGDIYVSSYNSTKESVFGEKGPLVQVSDLSVAANSTNVSITWKMDPVTSEASLSWGNATANLPYEQNITVTGAGSASVFLDYLEPDEGYHFIVTDRASGYLTSTWEGEWSTGTDSLSEFSGTVYNEANVSDSTDLYVNASCAAPPPPNYEDFYSWNVTSDHGHYAMGVPYYQEDPFGDREACGNGGYAIKVENWPVRYQVGLNFYTTGQWKGEWNETLVVYAPQVVNLYLPEVYTSPYIPVTYDFTNSSNVLFTVHTSSTFTTSESRNLSFQGAYEGLKVGGGSYSSSATTMTTSSSLSGVTGYSFEMTAQFLTSGTEVFSVFNRSVNLFPTYYEATGNTTYGPTNQSDWLARPACGSDPGVVNCAWGDSSTPAVYTMTQGGSTTLTSAFDVGVSVPIDIPGIGSLTAGLSDSYTTSFTSDTSFSVGFSYTYPTQTVCYGYEYVYQGDVSGSNGVVIHVWNLGTEPLGDC
jgi:YVTN family beta-propeller protein